METIFFFIKTKEHGWLSNFAAYPIMIDGREWLTNEHFYQAQKFTDDPEWMEAIRLSPRTYDAWRMGRNPNHVQRSDWELVKEEVMRTALRAKFAQHADLRALLLATGEAMLVEHSLDTYWGDGIDGTGKNRLGHLLMEVRRELREAC